jgi:UDP-N-acetylmuramyl pentapeptide synthase
MTKTEDLYKVYLRHPSVQTDTRKLKQGDLFFALKGPNFNANEFAKKQSIPERLMQSSMMHDISWKGKPFWLVMY